SCLPVGGKQFFLVFVASILCYCFRKAQEQGNCETDDLKPLHGILLRDIAERAFGHLPQRPIDALLSIFPACSGVKVFSHLPPPPATVSARPPILQPSPFPPGPPGPAADRTDSRPWDHPRSARRSPGFQGLLRNRAGSCRGEAVCSFRRGRWLGRAAAALSRRVGGSPRPGRRPAARCRAPDSSA